MTPGKYPTYAAAYDLIRTAHPWAPPSARRRWARHYNASGKEFAVWFDDDLPKLCYVQRVLMALPGAEIQPWGLIRTKLNGRWIRWGRLHTPECDALVTAAERDAQTRSAEAPAQTPLDN